MREIKIRNLIFIEIVSVILVLFLSLIFLDRGNYSDTAIEAENIILQIVTLTMLMFWSKTNLKVIKETIIDFKQKFKWREILGVTLVQMAFSSGMYFLLSVIVYYFNPSLLDKLLNEGITKQSSITVKILLLISMVIMAPLFEEIVFRGIIFKRLAKKFGIYFGLITSSVLFGVLHQRLDIIGAVVFGLVMCIMYKKYNNIIIPMSIHFINNLVAGLEIFTTSNASEEVKFITEGILYEGIWYSILFIASIGFLLKFINENKRYLK